MTRRVPIKLHVANALQWLGTLYRSPAEAIKEHISNAIDEHLKACRSGGAPSPCKVAFKLERSKVTIEYPYGMSQNEFQGALERVADSAKQRTEVAQIGRLGIGIFSFQQIGRKCTFLSRKTGTDMSIQVVLKEGTDEAEFDAALKRDALDVPGIRIIISELKFDPTRVRGPLAPEKLKRLFQEKYDRYLREGWLQIVIQQGAETTWVEPLRIDLPRVAKGLESVHISGDEQKKVRLELYFDPSGKGKVAIRHMGVVVVDDISQHTAYGLEESVYGSGDVKGFIDADFLHPSPARTTFEENRDWESLLVLLNRHRPQVEAEVEELKEREREKALSDIQKKAIQLAREILDLQEFRDLELPGQLAKPRGPAQEKRSVPTGERTGERSHEPGQKKNGGLRINYVEKAFEDGAGRHSRIVGGTIECNDSNPDYIQEKSGPEEAQVAYGTLIIGKETVAYNDKSGGADDHLERLLGFYFKLKARLAPSGPVLAKRGRGRPRKVLQQD
jgi:hypothetical protein